MISREYPNISEKKTRLQQYRMFPHISVSDTDPRYTEELFRLSRDANNNSIYEKYDEIDVQLQINSYEDGCSLTALLSRCGLMPGYAINQALQQVSEGQSVDTTLFPKDPAEAFAILSKAKTLIPNLAELVASGHTFDDIMKMISSAASAAESADSPNTTNKEVPVDVSNESSDD